MKKPSFSGFGPFRRLLSLLGWLGRFFGFCTVVLFECIVLYVWSAFLFYTRPAVVCKNFSDFNSHHFLIPAAHIFQERSVCAPSRSLCMYWCLIPVSINQFLHQNCSYCLFPSIYPSITFENRVGSFRFIRIGKARNIHPETLLCGTLKGLHRAVRCIIFRLIR